MHTDICMFVDRCWLMGWDENGPTLRSDVRHRIDVMNYFAFPFISFFAANVCKAVSLDYVPSFPTNYVAFLSIRFFAANICKAVSLHFFPYFPTNYAPNLQFDIVRLYQVDTEHLTHISYMNNVYVFNCSLEQRSEFPSPGEKYANFHIQ